MLFAQILQESPVVANWVIASLEIWKERQRNNDSNKNHRLTPEVEDSYWVNLIGRGYPYPQISDGVQKDLKFGHLINLFKKWYQNMAK